jgi:hypothetical protein
MRQTCNTNGSSIGRWCSGLLLVLLTSACTGLPPSRSEPDALAIAGQEPPIVAAQQAHVAAAEGAAPDRKPEVSASSVAKPATPAASAPSTTGKPAQKPAVPVPQAASKPAQAMAGPPSLDLKTLEARLKQTRAIGVMTKLAIKNQVDDLLERFRAFYQGRVKTTLAELRQPYDRLVLKVVALVQDGDPPLAGAIVASREAIWSILADPAKFAEH